MPKFIQQYLGFIQKYRWLVLLVSISFSASGLYLGSKFTIKADLMDLLPHDFQTVKSLKKVSEVTGGIGYLVAVAEGPDRKKNLAYLEKFSEAAEKDQDVLYVDFKVPSEFIERNGILWISLKDLKTIEQDLMIRIDYFRKKYLSLLPEELGDPPPFKTRKLMKNLETELSKSPYHEERNGQIVISIIKPTFDSSDITRTQALVDRMNFLATDIAKLYPEVEYSFTGMYDMKLSQMNTLLRDSTRATIFTVIGVTLAMLIFYRSPKAIFISLSPLIIGLIWTIGVNYFLVGHMNLISSFFISVLLGIGIDYNLQIYSRFKEEYLKSRDYMESLTITFLTTGKATLFGAFTTLFVFIILIFSNFLAFHETGILATVGIVMVFLSLVINMPLMVFIMKPSFSMFKKDHEREETEKDFSVRFMTWIFNRKGLIIAIFAIFIAAGGFFQKHMKFEYDFLALEDVTSPSRIKWHELSTTFNFNLIPAIVMVDSLEKLDQIRAILRKKDNTNEQFYAKHMSILDFYPYPNDDLVYRVNTVNHIRQMLVKNINSLSESDQISIKKYLNYLYPRPTSLEEYPKSILNALMGNDNGKPVYFYLVYPPPDIGLGLEAIEFAEKLKKLGDEAGFDLHLTSDSILLEEILNLVMNEGRIILPASFLAIFILVFISFKSLKKTVIIMAPLVLGLYFLGAFMGLTNLVFEHGLTFNYLNAIGIPILLGTGVDYSIHIFHRLEETLKDSKLTRVQQWRKIVETSTALLICSITTIIGFSSMFLARFVGLKSIAWVGVSGITIILIVSSILMPALFFTFFGKTSSEKKND
jgi:hypothetical protein